MHDRLRPGDRNDVVVPQQPRERELRSRTALALRERRDRIGEAQIRGEIIGTEARLVPARIVRRQILGTAEASGKKTATERAISDEGDTEFARRRQNVVGLDVARPERKLALQCGDRMHRVCPPQRFGPNLREAEVADFARRHQLAHRADGLLDRRLGVGAMQVQQVDTGDV